MACIDTAGRRTGTLRPEWKDIVDGVGRVPAVAALPDARAVLDRDGVVLLRDQGSDPERLVVAAATLLGARLRELFGIRPQGGPDAPPLGLHSDGANVVVDVHGRPTRLRDPDEDYLLMLCGGSAARGGDSVLVDGYALVDTLRAALPDLHAFLTGCDVDYFGSWTEPPRGVPAMPLVRRLVEHTRGGRRAIRASDYAAPVPREPRAAQHQVRLDEYADLLATAMAGAPRFRLAAGDLLVLDNYRFLHGRDGYTGDRTLHVLTVRSTDAF